MAKPIFLVKIAADIPRDRVMEIYTKLSEQITDWHILIVAASAPGTEASFQEFSEKTATDIEIEELKKLCLKAIE